MNSPARNPTTTMRKLSSMVTKWLPLVVLSSLLGLVVGEECDWTEHFDNVMQVCASCADICDPLRGTMKQCYNECSEFARRRVTCQLGGAPTLTDAMTTVSPPGGEAAQSVSAWLIVVMVASVVFLGLLPGAIMGFCSAKYHYTKKQTHLTREARRYMPVAQHKTQKGTVLVSPENEANASLYMNQSSTSGSTGSDMSDQTYLKTGDP